MYITTHPNDVV